MRSRLAAVAMTAGLAACQTVGGSPMSGLDAELTAAGSDYRRTVGEGIAVGAVVGTVAGALIGNAQGGSDGALRGALVGAAAGGALGGLGGVAVAENKERYVAAENRLDADIAEARSANTKLTTLLAVARRLVAQRRSEAAALHGAGAADVASRRDLLAKLRQNRRVLDESIAKAEQQRDRLKGLVADYRDASGTGTLASQASATGSAAAGLRRERDALVGIEGTLR